MQALVEVWVLSTGKCNVVYILRRTLECLEKTDRKGEILESGKIGS